MQVPPEVVLQREKLAHIIAKAEEKGSLIREMKLATSPGAVKANKPKLEAEIAELKALKKQVDTEMAALEVLELSAGLIEKDTSDEFSFCRKNFDTVIKQKFVYGGAFSIYGGVAGLYDMGPVGTTLKNNIVSCWRNHFLQDASMMEIECTMLTPEPVLAASGHVDRFTDLMVVDNITGEYYRADHLVEAGLAEILAAASGPAILSADRKAEAQLLLNTVDNYGSDPEKVHAVITSFGIKSPLTQTATGEQIGGNELSYPRPFNLMFKTSIGPNSAATSYLRPETAQGIFVNFKRCLAIHSGTGGSQLPLGIAQVGYSFRNEISPRSGLLRVREFLMGEIEYFVHPAEKNACSSFFEDPIVHYLPNLASILAAHPQILPGFKNKTTAAFERLSDARLCDLHLTLLPARQQEVGNTRGVQMNLKEAVLNGTINNNTLAFFLAKIFLFLLRIGVNPGLLRFRQHMCTEMAHYASDCWDAESKLSYGWTEIVGCADRSAFDLTNHAKATNTDMNVIRNLDANEIHEESYKTFVCDGKLFGRTFKKEASKITTYLTQLETRDVEELHHKAMAVIEGSKNAEISNATANRGAALEITLPDGEVFQVPAELLTQVKAATRKITTETFVPNVIEPSFGIGRILYTVLEHCFYTRDNDIQRSVFRFEPSLAPNKVSVLSISNNHSALNAIVRLLAKKLTAAGVLAKTDFSSTTIGRRYARFDSLGVPYAVTVDFESAGANSDTSQATFPVSEPTHAHLFDADSSATVTLRERDSMGQVRLSTSKLVPTLQGLVQGHLTWSEVLDTFTRV